MIKAILFDLDGVLIETERETFKFYQEYLKERGIILKDENFKYKAGRKSVDFWKNVLTPEQLLIIDTKELTKLKREKFNTEPDKFIKKMAGGTELLNLLKENGFRLALVSQNESRMIETALSWLDAKKYFQVILSIDMITNLKPHPEIYLLAARKLGAAIAECVVVEDSKDGVAAAKNAKMKCIGVRHEYTPAGNLDKADIIINKLAEINLNLLKNL